jgi:Sulfotransferase domain
MTYVKRVVPKEKLFFFDVKDGWEPLCEILGCPVPDEPFPKLNNADENREFMASFLQQALFKWLQIIAILAGVVAMVLYVLT